MSRAFKIRAFPLYLLLFFAAALFGVGCNTNDKRTIAEEAKKILEGEDTGIFLSMYDISGFREEDFSAFRGIPTYVERKVTLKKTKSVSYFLESVLASEESRITHVFLGIDPERLSEDTAGEEELLALIRGYGDVDFDILYPARTEAYYLKNGPDEETIRRYIQCTESFAAMENVRVYCAAGERWLMCNPSCFASDSSDKLTPEAACILIRSCFCDGLYSVADASSVSAVFNTLNENLEENKELGLTGGDLKDRQILFLGDSIFGNYTQPTSIPAIVEILSGADTANCGIGGLTLYSEHGYPGVKEVMRVLTKEKELDASAVGSMVLKENRDSFLHGQEILATAGDNAPVIILEYGLNDYMDGVSTENFKRTLNEAVDRLETAAEGSELLLMVPGAICMPYTEDGALPFAETGGTLEEYRQIIREVGAKRNIRTFEILETENLNRYGENYYLEEDGIHYGLNGRYILATELIRAIKQ